MADNGPGIPGLARDDAEGNVPGTRGSAGRPRKPARRGRCDTCGSRQRLRRDGSVAGHPDRSEGARTGAECPGSGKAARPLRFAPDDLPECGECLMYLASPANAMLGEAAASVSIESAKSPGQLLREYLAAYHDRDHKELDLA